MSLYVLNEDHGKIPHHQEVKSNEHPQDPAVLSHQGAPGEGELLLLNDDIPCVGLSDNRKTDDRKPNHRLLED